MGNMVTVFEHIDGKHSCLYGWDDRDIDRSEITKSKKIYIPDPILSEIKTCTISRLEEILCKL